MILSIKLHLHLTDFQSNSFPNESVKRELGGIVINTVKIQISQI